VRPLRLLVPLIAAVLVLPLVFVPADAEAQSLAEIQDALREAAAERREVEQRLAAAAAELDQLEVEIARLETEHAALTAEAGELEAELGELSEVIAFRVRETFMHGSNLDPIAVFLASDDPGAALSRAQTVQRLVSGDQVQTDQVAASRSRLDAVTARVAEQGAQLDAARERQQQVTEQLTADLERAQQLEAQLTRAEREERDRLERERLERERRERERQERERQERERLERERQERQERERQQAARREADRSTASSSSSSGSSEGSSGGSSGSSGSSSASSAPASSAPAPSSGGKACPLDQPRHFTDTWGAPRSGGRSHRGTDILGPYGIPVRAITSGTWAIQKPGPSAGLWAILRGDDGNQYWYMHLQSHTVANGAKVSAGQQVGTNGDTGNARGTPHIHFELHPGGGSAVNPYRMLKSVCG
jgi:peptidoglycan LD-endopeptidase LytH